MGFQGELNSVSLGDIFQTLHMNRQTGTLSVGADQDPGSAVHVWFDQGLVAACSAPIADGRPFLINTLLKKNLLSQDVADDLVRRMRSTNQASRDLLLASNVVAENDLDEVSTWCIEEIACPIFERTVGEFRFSDGDPLDVLAGPNTIWMGGTRIQTSQVVLEATRRRDEWQRIREVITDAEALYQVDADGRSNLRNVQTDPEMLKVLRYLDGRHTLDSIAAVVGVTRFDTYAITSQLVLAGVARARTPQEVVEDAVTLRTQGETQKAKDLLENILRSARVPEVLRPLAEACAALNQVPRAVELFLELIQRSQDSGELETALKDLDTVIQLSPEDPDLQFERAQIQGELGRLDEAASGYVAAAQVFLTTKETPRAIDACHRAKNLLPRSPEPHRWLAKAYLMDGATDNATVEYKALWHALLSSNSPTKALRELRAILDADCKFASVKEAVLAHAQSSEAVKTSRTMRIVAWAALVLMLIGAGVVGWEYWRGVIVTRNGQEAVAEVKQTYNSTRESLPHKVLLEMLTSIRSQYASVKEVVKLAEDTENEIRKDFDQRASNLLAEAQAYLRGGLFDKAYQSLSRLKADFAGTRSAGVADAKIEELRSTRIGVEVLAVVDDARRKWTALEWDDAINQLKPVLARNDLPLELKNEYQSLSLEWTSALGSAQELLARARKIRANGDRRAAIVALRRAATGQGESAVALAKNELAEVESEVIADIGLRARTAASKGDDAGAFSAVEDLLAVAKQSTSTTVQGQALATELPFTVTVDHPRTVLQVARPNTETAMIRAPADATGRWTHALTYRLGEQVVVAAARPGFTTASLTVSVQGKRSTGSLALTRGPRWSIPLNGVGTVGPVVFDRQVMIGTNRASIEVVDVHAQQGSSRPINFGEGVAEFRYPPTRHGTTVLAVVDERIFGVDLATRAVAWSWPTLGSRIAIAGPACAHENELIPGQSLVFAGAGRNNLAILAVDSSGGVVPYKPLTLPGELTGQPFVERSELQTVLYLPAGNVLVSYDIGSVTESSPPKPLNQIKARGDLIGQAVRATAAGKSVVLLTDSSGLVIAFDPGIGVDEGRRTVGGWALDGTSPSNPVVDGSMAYIAVSEGRVQAIDLNKSGVVAWRFPAQGSTAGLLGSVARGKRGVYAADANGILYCIDAVNGTLHWKAPLGGGASAGVAALDGLVVVPLATGQLVCFDEGDE